MAKEALTDHHHQGGSVIDLQFESKDEVEVPAIPGLCYFLVLFVRLRWIAASGALLATIATQQLIGEAFNYPIIYLCIGLIFLYNAVFHKIARGHHQTIRLETLADEPDRPFSRKIAIWQITLDLLALYFLLHFSGGLENPFVLFFVFHVVGSSILLKPKVAIIETSFAVFLVFALGVFEKLGWVPHHHPAIVVQHHDLTDSWLFVIGLSSAMAFTMFALSALTLMIMRERRRRHKRALELSAALRDKNRKLHEINQMRRGLLAVASHDLKSPINAVSSYLMLIEEGYLGEVKEKQLGTIRKCLTRLDGLKHFINDVLSMTALDSGQMEQDKTMTHIEVLLDEIVEHHRNAAELKGLRFNYQRPSEVPPIMAAESRIRQVFENLLSNAVKYTLEGGEVAVLLRVDEWVLELEVRDSGIGIKPEELGHLFEDFYRAPSVKGDFEGTGLGLSVVRRIVRAHKGRIWAESTEGEGSSFFVRFPLTSP